MPTGQNFHIHQNFLDWLSNSSWSCQLSLGFGLFLWFFTCPKMSELPSSLLQELDVLQINMNWILVSALEFSSSWDLQKFTYSPWACSPYIKWIWVESLWGLQFRLYFISTIYSNHWVDFRIRSQMTRVTECSDYWFSCFSYSLENLECSRC